MKWVGCILLLAGINNIAWAESYPRQECLGRVAFDTPEPMEWAVFPAENAYLLADANTPKPMGWAVFPAESIYFLANEDGEILRFINTYYDFDGVIVYVSDMTTRDVFNSAINDIYERDKERNENLKRSLNMYLEIIQKSKVNGKSTDSIRKFEQRVQDIEAEISLTGITEYDLEISDARVLGRSIERYYAILWRNQRVYIFDFSVPTTVDHIKDIASRFRARELYEVPKEAGICFPYGFIADDGKTAYRVKNSLRFSRTPNLIFNLTVASADAPSKEPPNDLYIPVYDMRFWQKTSLVDSLYFGKHPAAFNGWRLDPKPGSGEQYRSWFGYAYTDSLPSSRPLMAVHVFAIKKGVEQPPPPSDALPRLKALTSSMSVR